jgi:5-methylcytosine-specific restriction enzyme A
MGLKRYHRHSASVLNSNRWPALRLAAKRRDGFACVECGGLSRLEVDHVKPVRSHPEGAFDLSNLQTLCAACHARKTRIECGYVELSEPRQAWRDLLRTGLPSSQTMKEKDHA